MAVAAVKGTPKIEHFTERGIKDPDVLAISDKVQPNLCLPYDQCSGVLTPGRVDIETKQGNTYSMTVEYCYGHPKNPMSRKDFVDKFMDCASYAVRPLTEKNPQRVVEMTERLEQIEDVAEIMPLLA